MRITISFKDKYIEEYNHALKQDNVSRYICELIRKDLYGNNDIEEKILSILNNMPQKRQEVSSVKKNALQNMLKKK